MHKYHTDVLMEKCENVNNVKYPPKEKKNTQETNREQSFIFSAADALVFVDFVVGIKSTNVLENSVGNSRGYGFSRTILMYQTLFCYIEKKPVWNVNITRHMLNRLCRSIKIHISCRSIAKVKTPPRSTSRWII